MNAEFAPYAMNAATDSNMKKPDTTARYAAGAEAAFEDAIDDI